MSERLCESSDGSVTVIAHPDGGETPDGDEMPPGSVEIRAEGEVHFTTRGDSDE